jgi:hypothetical protein
MCEPVTLALMGASVAASAYSASKQTQAQNDANEYNAAVMEKNAAYSELQAKDAESRGSGEAARAQSNIKNAVGEQKAGLAKAGVVVGSGSAQNILDASVLTGNQDAMMIKANAAREAQGFRMQAQNTKDEAMLRRNANVNPMESAGVSLLSGASTISQRMNK